MRSKKLFFLFLLLAATPLYAEDGQGFHVGTVSGAGFAIQDGNLSGETPLSLLLELGYNFGNQLDVIGRGGYSPLLWGDTPDIQIYTYGIGIRYIFLPSSFSPYAVTLLGAYTSSSNTSGDAFFKSQTGFHNADALGIEYRFANHHSVGMEFGTQIFLNDRVNLVTTIFAAAYRFTF
ncbi:MAG: outer membrane beta-barrel protein [Deltaproteobacteria bacterium]|nr:outer membrane beta-barrel protein [Deltaproteobacteria bacterium]